MPFKKNKSGMQAGKNEGVVKSIFIAYSILLFHLIILAVLGLMVLFFRGVVNYMTWIFLGGLVLVAASGYYFIRKIKKEQNTIREILMLPEFAGKDIEIRLLGGAASFKVGSHSTDSDVKIQPQNQYIQLQNPVKSRIDNLSELSRLYENQMISKKEYEDLKKDLLGTPSSESDDVFDLDNYNEKIQFESLNKKSEKNNDQN
ncbi:MAG: hypothetical protein H6681_06300 [Desulfobacteraceae bacterium]|nr:hypothetical protein [Desulfobacteraceae bacterium]